MTAAVAEVVVRQVADRVQHQVAEANYHGLGWMVITDHGGTAHNKISVDLTYPEIVTARAKFPNMLVFAGLEMNIPGGEHGTVMIQPNSAEKDQLKAFEASYDGGVTGNPNTEAAAVAGERHQAAVLLQLVFAGGVEIPAVREGG